MKMKPCIIVWMFLLCIITLPLQVQAECACKPLKQMSFGIEIKGDCPPCRYRSARVSGETVVLETREGRLQRFQYKKGGTLEALESDSAEFSTSPMTPLPTSINCTGESSELLCTTPDPSIKTSVPEGFFDRSLRFLSSGDAHSCAANDAGDVFCWGSNHSGQLGSGVYRQLSSTPLKVPLPDGSVSHVSVSNDTSCAIMNWNELYCWGRLWDATYQSFAHTIVPHKIKRSTKGSLQSVLVFEDGLLILHRDGSLGFQPIELRPIESMPRSLSFPAAITNLCQHDGRSYLRTARGELYQFGQAYSASFLDAPYAIWESSWMPVASPHKDVESVHCSRDVSFIRHENGDQTIVTPRFYDHEKERAHEKLFEHFAQSGEAIVSTHVAEKHLCMETEKSSFHCSHYRQTDAIQNIHLAGHDTAVLLDTWLVVLTNGSLTGYPVDAQSGDLWQPFQSDQKVEKLSCGATTCCAQLDSGELACFSPQANEINMERVVLPQYHHAHDIEVKDSLYVVTNQGWLYSYPLKDLTSGSRITVWDTFHGFIEADLTGNAVCLRPKSGGVRCFYQGLPGDTHELREAREFNEIVYKKISGRPGTYLLALTETGDVHVQRSEGRYIKSLPGNSEKKFLPVADITGTVIGVSHGHISSCVETDREQRCFHHGRYSHEESIPSYPVHHRQADIRASLQKQTTRSCNEHQSYGPDCWSAQSQLLSMNPNHDGRLQEAHNDSMQCRIKDGKVFCRNEKHKDEFLPLDHLVHSAIKELRASNKLICARSAGYRVYCWGNAFEGEVSKNAREMLPQVAGVAALSSGDGVICANTLSNQLFCMSTEEYGTIYEQS